MTAALAGAGQLGDDQAAAVALLAGPGPALRALIAPAGYGKTTTLAAAVDAARRAGRPVLAVSTTNQAVDQLRQVGIPAITVARFALDRTELPPGCVVIVDEFSQLSTRDADVVLAAAAACPGGQVWMVGDPLQAQPVGAGGLAAWLVRTSTTGSGADGRADGQPPPGRPHRTTSPGSFPGRPHHYQPGATGPGRLGTPPRRPQPGPRGHGRGRPR